MLWTVVTFPMQFQIFHLYIKKLLFNFNMSRLGLLVPNLNSNSVCLVGKKIKKKRKGERVRKIERENREIKETEILNYLQRQ